MTTNGGRVIQAVIFDLDGTLVETEELKALSYARAARELRPTLSEAEVVEAFKEEVGANRDLVDAERYPTNIARRPAHGRLGYPRGLATMSHLGQAQRVLGI